MIAAEVALDTLLKLALSAAENAAAAVMKIYNEAYTTALKADHSPVTQADIDSHNIITSILETSKLPIISEENEAPITINHTDTFWLVDPLDGTKEFLQKNGEFTINIALIKNHRPILGVISVPATQTIYYATANNGAYKLTKHTPQTLHTSIESNLQSARLAVSRSHLQAEDQAFIKRAGIQNVKPLGSALKYCELAEGNIDLSVRYTPLMQWDIAASDILVQEAGGTILNFQNKPYMYHADSAQTALTNGIIANNGLIIIPTNLIEGTS